MSTKRYRDQKMQVLGAQEKKKIRELSFGQPVSEIVKCNGSTGDIVDN